MTKVKILGWIAGSSLVLNSAIFAQDKPGAPDAATSNGIESTSKNDPAIERSIKSVLPANAKNIRVKVTDGIVYLSGEVSSKTDYESVITLSESTPGVNDVQANGLEVKSSQNPLKDTYITAMIKGAILRADILGKDIPTWSVHVETQNGVVYLSGMIGSLPEKKNILSVVRSINGVSSIQDDMVVTNESPPKPIH